MGKLIDGDDGLLAENVGAWTKEKHEYLCRYVDISRAVRARWIGPDKAGATYIDPFCGTGRCKVRETGEWIDGGAVAAWKKSCAGGAPFTRVFIGDLDTQRRQAAAARLRQLGASVEEMDGAAAHSVQQIVASLDPYGLHFAFLDPFNLGALDFGMIKSLSKLKRIDILVHISQMDLQRNLLSNTRGDKSVFDQFAPGWRGSVDLAQHQSGIRRDLFQYWRDQIASLGVWPSTEMKLITGSKNNPLYWLLLAAKHELAHKFWATASNVEGQGELF
ncbi:three-Cys-motif partner protein TcmP [Verminephrobacter aporrectodeae subsp. tuberculatae]|uniref:three-Cys-motif partner protein TcmP n=1 Tax=Verminephrobacter aporrectodeae TaxID=1110389 RepID=UPI0022385C0A|nr:three-Cys-motif partner protein TcmP [Verminephrobacter aporrectodeae]MCW5222760.1 three-Cys-motif partner protein TcmP [Verminephrobacter aporrectodeae subsp. tuberculatae]MCW5288224.1 three-Cys-motif partner protein TcmP [Verminephrobacter aporrectodeae subsp. tuberculatae]MCW8197072.1 three-Cys-motif partner protein TcmP [Verminephrobacter aporrectodeae subsp. tuberculatae]